MNWEQLSYKLAELKALRDVQPVETQPKLPASLLGSDPFQDPRLPHNYTIQYESLERSSVDYLEAQIEGDDNYEEKIGNQYSKTNAGPETSFPGKQIEYHKFEDFCEKENDQNYAKIGKGSNQQQHFSDSRLNKDKDKHQFYTNSQAQKTKEENSLSLDDMNTFATIGTGTFGRVKMAKIKGNENDIFALKIMKKIKIVKLKQVDHIKSEKTILSSIQHPFLVQLKGSFQDERYVYMLFEFVSGGEIFSRLRKEGRFSNDVSLFYISQIYLALHYLHSQNIVYRDLKPENLLIDKEGNVKIADFGFSKYMNSSRTYTLCGTPEYLAPEIIQGAKSGYGMSVDWWALGVLVFEMLSGHPPFYDTDPLEIYKKIVRSVISFPDFFSLRAKDLVRKLLNPDISQRLGCLEKGSEIARHKWFRGVNWEKVVQKQIPAPWLPPLKAKDDLSCFEKYPDSPESPIIPPKEMQIQFKDF